MQPGLENDTYFLVKIKASSLSVFQEGNLAIHLKACPYPGNQHLQAHSAITHRGELQIHSLQFRLQ